MHALAKEIRNTRYRYLIDQHELDARNLDEHTPMKVDQIWIEREEQGWRARRENIQRLEYKRTDPPDPEEQAAARSWTLQFPLHTPDHLIVSAWVSCYKTKLRALESQRHHLETRLRHMDPRCKQHCEGMLLLKRIRESISMLPLFSLRKKNE